MSDSRIRSDAPGRHLACRHGCGFRARFRHTLASHERACRRAPDAAERPPRRLTKDAAIHLHVTLLACRRAVEALGLAAEGAWREYDARGVLPQHVHREIGDHLQAVQHLATGLRRALHVDDDRDAGSPRTRARNVRDIADAQRERVWEATGPW